MTEGSGAGCSDMIGETILSPQRPPGVVPLTQAIEGDESPWPYLSVSVRWRKGAEFGTRWHGCAWSNQAVLSKPSRQAEDPTVSTTEWHWAGDAPGGAPRAPSRLPPRPRGAPPHCSGARLTATRATGSPGSGNPNGSPRPRPPAGSRAPGSRRRREACARDA